MPENIYFVSTISTIYSESLSSSFDAQLIILEGFYFDKKGKLYGKSFFDELHDKNKQNKITICLNENIKSKLSSGKYYQFEGYINKGKNITNDSRLQVYFNVTKILKHESEVQFISKHEYDIVRERFDREFPVIKDVLLEKIEKGSKPLLDIITGVQSTSEEDYLNQLYDDDFYTIRHHRCNLSSQTDMLKFLEKHSFNNTDLLIILRGGGTGLEVFNEVNLCKKFIELPVPFITGIGHHEDVTLLQRVSDKGFSTPTSVGVFLQKTVDVYKKRKQEIEQKEVEIVEVNKKALENKLLLVGEIKKQKRLLTKVLIIASVLLIIMALALIKISS